MSAHPTAAISAVTAGAAPDPTLPPAPVQAPAGSPRVSFSQMISNGLDTINQRAADADAQVKAFVLDDSIPPHRVIYALEKSQMSLQLMLQVRNKVIEDYQDIMRMQL